MRRYSVQVKIIGGEKYDLPRSATIPRIGDSVYLREIDKSIVISDVAYCYSKGIFSRKRTLDFIVLFSTREDDASDYTVVNEKRKEFGLPPPIVCGPPSNRVYLHEGYYHCEVCGGKWKSLAE